MKKFVGLFLICLVMVMIVRAAQLEPGHSFTPSEQVTSDKLNNLVSNATISGIVSSEITDLTIATGDIANQAITAAKIADSTITTGKIANRAITTGLIATGAVTEIELSTNITFRPGFLVFTNMVGVTFSNQQLGAEWSVSVSNTVGVADANKLVRTRSTGAIDRSLLVGSTLVTSSNRVFAVGNASANVWTNIISLTTTATNGTVMLTANAISDTGGGQQYIRIRDLQTNAISQSSHTIGTGNPVQNVILIDTLSGVPKTYLLDVSSSAANQPYTNVSATPFLTNGLYLRMLEMP